MFIALLVGSATAQVAKVLPLADSVAALQARSNHQEGSVSSLERLARLVRSQWQNDAQGTPKVQIPRRRRSVIEVAEKESTLLVSADQQPADFAIGIVELLRKDPARELRVHCTLVHLPMQVATEHALVAGQVTPVDEPTAGKLLKAAVQAKGRVHNLPELEVQPLLPFRAEPPTEAGKPATTIPTLRLRGEAVLVEEQEALFGVQLVAGDLPADPTVLPKAPLFDRTFRLRAGTGILVLAPTAQNAPADAPAVVVWLRLASVTATKPAKEPAAGDAGK